MPGEIQEREPRAQVRVVECFTVTGRIAMPDEVVEVTASEAHDLVRRGIAVIAE